MTRPIYLEDGFLTVPRRVANRMVAEEETRILFSVPESTLNTGKVKNERTHLTVECIEARLCHD